MPTRRPLLALPLLLVARPFRAAASSWRDAAPSSWRDAAASPWRDEVSELRLGGVTAAAASARLGVPVRVVTAGLAEALNEGHLEAALLDRATAARAEGLMGDRLITVAAGSGVVAIRRALPAGLRADLHAALSAAA